MNNFSNNSTLQPYYDDEDDGSNTIPLDTYRIGACISSLSLLTNFTIIAIILSKPNLRTVSNAILISSCLSALIFGLIIILIALVASYGNEPFRSIVLSCILGSSTELSFLSIFNLHLTSLSLERFFSILYPFKYRRFAIKKVVTIFITCLWLIPICSIYFLALIAGVIHGNTCSGWNEVNEIDLFFSYVVLPFIFLLPPSIIFISYAIIVWKIFTMQRKVSTTLTANPDQGYLPKPKLLQNWKAILQMFIVLGFYLMAFIPFIICYVILISTSNENVLQPTLISYVLIMSYLMIHPILSVLFIAPIKDEARKHFRRLYVYIYSYLRNFVISKCCCEKCKDEHISNQMAVQMAVQMAAQTANSRIASLC